MKILISTTLALGILASVFVGIGENKVEASNVNTYVKLKTHNSKGALVDVKVKSRIEMNKYKNGYYNTTIKYIDYRKKIKKYKVKVTKNHRKVWVTKKKIYWTKGSKTKNVFVKGIDVQTINIYKDAWTENDRVVEAGTAFFPYYNQFDVIMPGDIIYTRPFEELVVQDSEGNDVPARVLSPYGLHVNWFANVHGIEWGTNSDAFVFIDYDLTKILWYKKYQTNKIAQAYIHSSN